MFAGFYSPEGRFGYDFLSEGGRFGYERRTAAMLPRSSRE